MGLGKRRHGGEGPSPQTGQREGWGAISGWRAFSCRAGAQVSALWPVGCPSCCCQPCAITGPSFLVLKVVSQHLFELLKYSLFSSPERLGFQGRFDAGVVSSHLCFIRSEFTAPSAERILTLLALELLLLLAFQALAPLPTLSWSVCSTYARLALQSADMSPVAWASLKSFLLFA